MSQVINITDSKTIIPSGYDSNNSSYSSINSSYPVTNGYTDADSTSYAYITCNTGSHATTYISYTFDTSEIPENAAIDSITCKAKVRVSSTSYISTGVTQLYTGSIAKGSATTTRSTTATTYDLTTGTWTRTELNDVQVRFTGTRGTSNTTRAAYLYFYGATLTINYSINGTQYSIVATSNVENYEISPNHQNKMEGEEATVTITGNNLEDIIVTDNDIDITENLIQHTIENTGSVSAIPGENFETGFSSSNANFYMSSSSTGTTWLEYAIGHSAENPYTSSSSHNTYVKDNDNNTATGWISFPFDFSEIPFNAVIDLVTVKVYGARENSTTDSTHVAKFGVYCNGVLKGAEQQFTSTTSDIVTLTSPGTWTREELQSAELRFTVAYYGGHLDGATWTVSYSVPNTGNNYYWTYDLTNINADHVILIDQRGAFIPPEENPEYEYYPITISSINATTTPHNGSTRIIEGSNQTITISPSDPQLTLALDNGVDITSQLQGGTPENTYTITTQVSGASYGFNLNESTGYYVSTNRGVSNSAAVARLNMNFESNCLVTIQYINYAESGYDYGLFGKLDTVVSTSGLTASSGSSSPSDSDNYQLAMASNNSGTQTITYEVPYGEHFIDIKYGKDAATDSNNDTLQWKVLSIEATSAGGDYTYTLTNIQEKHSLIFIFGNVNYYFINSSGTECKLYPDGQMVKLEGDKYNLRIIPNDVKATVTIVDNNVNVTNLLSIEEGIDKNNNPIINYIYTLNNIIQTHNLVITCITHHQILYTKINGNWINFSKAYVKINGSWAEQTELRQVFDSRLNYVKGN